VATEPKAIDITNLPELARIAQEVRDTNEPCILRQGDEDLAVLMPARSTKKKRRRTQPVTHDDAIFRLVGIGRSGIPGGVSDKKHEYLARAYRPD
jgi:hypothetical protein